MGRPGQDTLKFFRGDQRIGARDRAPGTNAPRRRIAFYLPDLYGGGAEKMTLRLAHAFARRGHAVDLVVNARRGVNVDALTDELRVVELGLSSYWQGFLCAARAFPGDWPLLPASALWRKKTATHLRSLPPLVRYLRRQAPRAFIANIWSCNLNGVWARALAGADTRLMLTDHNTLSTKLTENLIGKHKNTPRPPAFRRLMGRLYARADARIAVSAGVGDDLAQTLGIARDTIQTIHNPVVDIDIEADTRPPDHPWFEPGAPPVVVSVGRLHPQKNYGALIEAFARLRRERRARLMIIGEGAHRADLAARIDRLDLNSDIALPGWIIDPYAYMRRASVFVLSSLWEGLPTVLIEAMACGTPVVATDCPHGPDEILDHGRYGELVAMRDIHALARAIARTLDAPPDPAPAIKRSQDFTLAKAVDAYERLLAG